MKLLAVRTLPYPLIKKRKQHLLSKVTKSCSLLLIRRRCCYSSYVHGGTNGVKQYMGRDDIDFDVVLPNLSKIDGKAILAIR